MEVKHYKQDLTGQKFGLLTVNGITDKTIYKGKRRLYLWECTCECGEVVYKHTNQLHSYNNHGCRKCMNKYRISKMNKGAEFQDGTQVSKIRNVPTESKRNRSGIRGVYFEQGKWRARLKFSGKFYHLGCYNTIEEAAAARKKGEQEIYGKYLDSLN